MKDTLTPLEVYEYINNIHIDINDDDDCCEKTYFVDNKQVDYTYYKLHYYKKFQLKSIKLDTLDLDECWTDFGKVIEYKDLYESGNTCYPPIVIGDNIIDGYHRANALLYVGVNSVMAYVGIIKNP